MPYPESCPECGGAFRNTGTHFTARRNEVGRHVLLELGCQNTSRRFWWNFSSGKLHDEAALASTNGVTTAARASASTNGHSTLATLERPAPAPAATTAPPAAAPASPPEPALPTLTPAPLAVELSPTPTPVPPAAAAAAAAPQTPEPEREPEALIMPASPPTLREAFVRQLQLDRLTLRQMRSLLMADEARRAIEVAAGATEATYERLALILFGADLAQLLGKQAPPPASTGLSAEERLELQREKARIRARLRRAAIKAAKQTGE